MMNPETQKRLDALVEHAVQKYGEDSGEAESARRVVKGTAEVINHSGSDLDFLGSAQKAHILTMERSQTACEAFCEKFCTVDNPGLKAFHLIMGTSKEAQKVTLDALHRLNGWFTSEPDGAGPLGTTYYGSFPNPDPADVPIAYATSRPGERWLIGEKHSFDSIAELVKLDAHCDFAHPPFSMNLQRHRLWPDRDCLEELAKQVALYEDCLENNIKWDFTIGVLFPVAFGNQVVFLRFCVDHFYGFCRKYLIDIGECEIIEPFEGLGDYW